MLGLRRATPWGEVSCEAICVVAVLAIVAYGHVIRAAGAPDVLARRLFHHPICQDIDGWSVTHLLFFGLLGWLYPGRHLGFLGLGIGWEVVETVLGQNRLEVSGKRLQLMGDQDADGKPTGVADAYWYGKESDIVVDMVGYCVGSALAERYWPEKAAGAGEAPACAGEAPAWITQGRPAFPLRRGHRSRGRASTG